MRPRPAALVIAVLAFLIAVVAPFVVGSPIVVVAWVGLFAGVIWFGVVARSVRSRWQR